VSAYLESHRARVLVLLESVEGVKKSRDTRLAVLTGKVFRYAGGACVMESQDRMVWKERDPISFLRERMRAFRPDAAPGLPPVLRSIGYSTTISVLLSTRNRAARIAKTFSG